MGRTWRTHGIETFGRNPERKRPMEHADVDRGINDNTILQVISKKWSGRFWTGFSYLRTGISDRLLWTW
jgi:hypothetical protein